MANWRLLVPILAVASALVAIATVVYVRRPGEYRATSIDGRESPIARETSDSVQPIDPWPLRFTRTRTWSPPGENVTATNAPAWERGEVAWPF